MKKGKVFWAIVTTSLACVLLALLPISFSSCSKDASFSHMRELSASEQLRVSEFEANYVKRMLRNANAKSTSRDEVFLVGFKTVAYHGSDSIFVNKLWKAHEKEIAEHGSFLTLDGQGRIYFPLSDAIVRINGIKYTADSKGVVATSVHDFNRVSVIGRERTEKTIYTKFDREYRPREIFRQERVLFFDLGERPLCHSDKHNLERLAPGEGGTGGGVSCTQNHGSYSNCTVAFMIAQPRCVTNYDRCMDYNGFGTDCSGNKAFFFGSDCSVALAMGHCWNEL